MSAWVVIAQAEEPEAAAATAAGWQQQLQAINDKVPQILGKFGVPTFPELPLLDIVTDFAFILAGIALLVALWRLLTLRILRSFFAVVAAMFLLYYPVAYGVHFWIYEHNRDAKDERGEDEIPRWEQQVRDNIRWVDYGLLGAGVFVGGTLLLISRPGKDRRDEEEEEQEEMQQPQARGSRRREEAAPWHQPPPKQRGGRSGSGGADKNPFDFS